MGFISARVSGKDEGTGIEDGDWETAYGGFVFKTIVVSAAGASWALWPKWEEEGGGSIATTSSFFA